MSGHYRMHRGWMDHPVLNGEPFCRRAAWAWLIENACWKDTAHDIRGKTVAVKRGQICVSTRHLADVFRWPETTVRRFLTRLKTSAMIGAVSGAGKNVITICNYDKYQSSPQEDGAENGAPSGAKSAQSRRTKERREEGKKKKEDNRFAFEQEVIRLTQTDFDRWSESFDRLDLKAELTALDAYYVSERDNGKLGNWFQRCAATLAKKQREAPAPAQTTNWFRDSLRDDRLRELVKAGHGPEILQGRDFGAMDDPEFQEILHQEHA